MSTIDQLAAVLTDTFDPRSVVVDFTAEELCILLEPENAGIMYSTLY